MPQPPQSTPESRELFADFGELMYEIQLFEFTLVGLVQVHGEELRGTPDYRPFLEELFRLTAGQLRQRVNLKNDELAALLEDTIRLRNSVVHGWLIYAGMDGAAGVKTTQQLREERQTIRRSVHHLRTRLDAIWQDELDKLPADDLTHLSESPTCGATGGRHPRSDVGGASARRGQGTRYARPVERRGP